MALTAYKMLVVEDTPTMRYLILRTLKRLKDVEIVEANDGVDALRKMAAGKFDIIFTDINMPMMDGLKLISLVRNDPANKDIPIVVITAGGGKEEMDKAMALGANAYFTKPIHTANLLSVAKELLKMP